MRYQDARPLINTGDIIGIATHGVLQTLIRWVQRIAGFGRLSDMTHVGIAKWVYGRLFIVEMDGMRNVMRPLSQSEGLRMYVFSNPVTEDAISGRFDELLDRKIAYGYWDLIRIGFRMIFGLEAPSVNEVDKDDQVCSHFVLTWLLLAGWEAPHSMPSEPSPCELCAPLLLKCTIDPSPV